MRRVHQCLFGTACAPMGKSFATSIATSFPTSFAAAVAATFAPLLAPLLASLVVTLLAAPLAAPLATTLAAADPRTEAAGARVVLVEDGEPRATIVIARDAGAKVETAAAELAEYIEKISGARLPIVREGGTKEDGRRGRHEDADRESGVPAAPQCTLILVGKSSLTAGLEIPSGLTGARREEGYLIQVQGLGKDEGPSSAAPHAARLVLAGNDEGPYHGTEYAVYDFLRSLGVRWFLPGEHGEVVPRLPTIAVEPRVVRSRPDFVMRNWWLHIRPPLAEEERRWKLRNKMNPDEMFAIPGDSSARNILPASRYFDEHPEYFALNADGTRNPHLPNLTHPEAVEIAAGIIVDHLRRSPGAESYGFAPDDGLPRDYSPETAKLNSGFVELGGRPGVPGEVSTSQEWFRFADAVCARVRREVPDAFIATNGYANRDFPPQGMDLDDHLVVMFAAIWSCTLHAYDDPGCWQKVRQGQMLRRWCELCPNVWIYGYNYGMLVSALTPIPETRKLRRDFPLMKRWGVMGFWDENRNVWAECGIASRYLRAQLEWDADADGDAILADFYATWYGKAAPAMRAYHDAIEDAIERTPIHGHEDRVLPEVYTPELIARLRPLIAEAESLAAEAQAVPPQAVPPQAVPAQAADPAMAAAARRRTHVRADRLIHEHLERYVELSEAEAEADWAAAAERARAMLAIRRDLHAIDPFYIWDDEDGYHTGVWYWKVSDRQRYYEGLRDLTSGKNGDLVALFPKEAAFRTDPHDDGLFAEWYRTATAGKEADGGWERILTTRPFYAQGHQDAAGHPYVGIIWYRLEADVPVWAAGRTVVLVAPVVETEAWCWVNGRYVGRRPYREAYERPSPIEIDITGAIRPGERNVVAIRVSTGLAPAQAASGLLSRVFLYAPRRRDP